MPAQPRLREHLLKVVLFAVFKGPLSPALLRESPEDWPNWRESVRLGYKKNSIGDAVQGGVRAKNELIDYFST